MTQITKFLGGPGIEKVLLDEDEIKSVCLFPAMIDYFNVFPKLETQRYQVSQTLDIPFPDEYVFGVTARVTDKDQIRYRVDPFYGLRQPVTTRGMIRKNRRSRVSLPISGLEIRDGLNQRQLRDSLRELETYSTEVDRENRVVHVFTTKACSVHLTWARFSMNFDNDVRFEQKRNVTDLAGAYLLEHAADAGSIIVDGTQEKEFNTDAMRSRAESIRERINEAWANHPRVLILRGS